MNMLPFGASLTSFCRNLGQHLSTICSFAGHTGDWWNSIAKRSILSMKLVLLSELAHVRFLQYCLAIVLYTALGLLVPLHTEVSTVSFFLCEEHDFECIGGVIDTRPTVMEGSNRIHFLKCFFNTFFFGFVYSFSSFWCLSLFVQYI